MLGETSGDGMKVGERLAHANNVFTRGVGGITVVLVDDQELIRSAVRQALSTAGFQVVGETDSGHGGVQAVLDLRPDVVVMDLVFRGTPEIEAIEQISLHAPATRILVLTASKERDSLIEAIVAGACGYMLKDAGSEAIVKAVRASAAGECIISPELAGGLLTRIRERDIRLTARSECAADAIRATLTERELEIFKRLASGESNQEIGREFSLSENTVKNHVASILAKLHLDNRIQAAVQAVRSGFSCTTGVVAVQAISDEGALPNAVVSFLFGG
jgi:two-component system nitrate/nitrite response regulator NarL